MALEKRVPITQNASSIDTPPLLAQYGCGPLQFTGSATRYMNAICFSTMWSIQRLAGAREQFEALPAR